MNSRLAFALLGSGLLAGSQIQAQTSSPGPTIQITTTDGRVYHDVTVIRTDPDGIFIDYTPDGGGLGMARLRFRNLPNDLQARYGYDAKSAADFEDRERHANADWVAQMNHDESLRRYRELAELHWALAGDASASYTVSLDADGKVSAHGYTGNVPGYDYTWPSPGNGWGNIGATTGTQPSTPNSATPSGPGPGQAAAAGASPPQPQ